MTRLTEQEVRDAADEYRRITSEALRAGEWHEAYRWAKGWISPGGGARSVEPWLVYVASSLLQGHRRTAVHSCDLALRNWIREEDARAVLRYVRGEVIRRHMEDPKTAQSDLDASLEHAPAWLRAEAETAAERCREEASASRKAKPRAEPAPAYEPGEVPDVTPTPADLAGVDRPPPVWEAVRAILVPD